MFSVASGLLVTGTKSCSDLTVLAPKTSAYTCEVDFTFASLFSHNDTYVESISFYAV